MNKRKYIIRAVHLINTNVIKTHWPLFLTMTYADPQGWQPCHISQLLQHYRKYIRRKRKGAIMPYVWRAEIQPDRAKETGEEVIHYHAVIWVPNGVKPPMPDKQGWWSHGSTNVQRAYSPAGYLAKYINKPQDYDLPKGARSYAVQASKVAILDFLRIPDWMKYYSQYGDKIQRVVGKGWYNLRTGMAYQSPYVWTEKGAKWVGWKLSSDWPDYYGFSNHKFALKEHLVTGVPF